MSSARATKLAAVNRQDRMAVPVESCRLQFMWHLLAELTFRIRRTSGTVLGRYASGWRQSQARAKILPGGVENGISSGSDVFSVLSHRHIWLNTSTFNSTVQEASVELDRKCRFEKAIHERIRRFPSGGSCCRSAKHPGTLPGNKPRCPPFASANLGLFTKH